MVLVLPIYEEEKTGVYYNTAAVVDADGSYLGKYRKHHIPHCAPGFWEKFYLQAGEPGLPRVRDAAGRIGVYICYDRHFPEGARILGLNGAEIVFNPSRHGGGSLGVPVEARAAGARGRKRVLRRGHQPRGPRAAMGHRRVLRHSYFCDPRGQIVAEAPRDQDAVVVADLDLDKIEEVRQTWQFYRDRRPETYDELVEL